MNVLSLFDGISCGRIALERTGIKVNRYFASEIDKYAIKVAMKNYPDTIQLGNVIDVKACDLPEIDLLIGGSPCQGFSFAGKRLNFDDPRSKLFFEFVRLLNEAKPKYFLLENVKMKKTSQDIISKHLGCEPIEINSALVSAQQRKRLYWTNIPNVNEPVDKKVYLKDILEKHLVDRNKNYYISSNYFKDSNSQHYFVKRHNLFASDKPLRVAKRGKGGQGQRVYSVEGKSVSLSALGGGWGAKTGLYLVDNRIRKLTPIECERLQTVPEKYTDCVSNMQRYKLLGNCWTVDVIAYIFNCLLDENLKQGGMFHELQNKTSQHA